MYIHLILQIIGVLVIVISALGFLWRHGFFGWCIKKITAWPKKTWLAVGVLLIGCVFLGLGSGKYPLNFAMPPMMKSKAPGELPASIPLAKIAEFFAFNDMETVDDIGADPADVPAPITRKKNTTVQFELVAQEVIADIADGISFNYWTYNKQVPGPMLRVLEGDTVEISLTNHESSLHPHNVDLHSVTGPGGGAAVTNVKPGETKTFTWKALQPGLYVYHCATANISTHNAHGQYGMILVQPKDGMPEVDHEFYIMQGELYTSGGIGKKGFVAFDPQDLLDGIPSYVTFNGRIEEEPRMEVKVGDRVRMYVGNGGLNQISSFHVIGEIFDTVYPEAAIGPNSSFFQNVQTTAVLPGGAAIVDFTVDVPGNYTLVDHALARMNKGAWSVLRVTGEQNPEIFDSPELDMMHE